MKYFSDIKDITRTSSAIKLERLSDSEIRLWMASSTKFSVFLLFIATLNHIFPFFMCSHSRHSHRCQKSLGRIITEIHTHTQLLPIPFKSDQTIFHHHLNILCRNRCHELQSMEHCVTPHCRKSRITLMVQHLPTIYVMWWKCITMRCVNQINNFDLQLDSLSFGKW